LDEAKGVLADTQERLVTAQAASFLARYRCCESCACPLRSKGRCRILFRTAFGTISLAGPRFHHCGCQPADSKVLTPVSFRQAVPIPDDHLFTDSRWAHYTRWG
jgi:hypothetical protein